MIIDTHCHYNLPPLAETWQKHWQDAQAATVQAAIVVGTNLETSQLAIDLALKESAFSPTVGIHPYVIGEYFSQHPKSEIEEAQTYFEEQLDQLRDLAKNPAVVAIGEVGLDYFRLPSSSAGLQVATLQQFVFRKQLEIAKDTYKPIILHVRDAESTAYFQTIEFVKQAKLNRPCILHCVSGPLEYVLEAIQIGAYIGVAGNVTYKSADHIRSLVQAAPKNRLLLETDAPYLPPLPHRGESCTPAMIKLTADFVQAQLGIDPDECAANAQLLFQLKNG